MNAPDPIVRNASLASLSASRSSASLNGGGLLMPFRRQFHACPQILKQSAHQHPLRRRIVPDAPDGGPPPHWTPSSIGRTAAGSTSSAIHGASSGPACALSGSCFRGAMVMHAEIASSRVWGRSWPRS